jgi:hypothetical protein
MEADSAFIYHSSEGQRGTIVAREFATPTPLGDGSRGRQARNSVTPWNETPPICCTR